MDHSIQCRLSDILLLKVLHKRRCKTIHTIRQSVFVMCNNYIRTWFHIYHQSYMTPRHNNSTLLLDWSRLQKTHNTKSIDIGYEGTNNPGNPIHQIHTDQEGNGFGNSKIFHYAILYIWASYFWKSIHHQTQRLKLLIKRKISHCFERAIIWNLINFNMYQVLNNSGNLVLMSINCETEMWTFNKWSGYFFLNLGFAKNIVLFICA